MHATQHKRTRRAQGWALTLADSISRQISDGLQIPFLLAIKYPEGQTRRVIQETMKARKERVEGRGPEWNWSLKAVPLESFIERPEGPARLFTIQVCPPGEGRKDRPSSPQTQEILASIQPMDSDDEPNEGLIENLYGI